MIDKQKISANNWANNDIDNANVIKWVKGIYKMGFERGVSRCKGMKGFTPDEVENILIEVGQQDRQFKLGEIIKYSPNDVRKILERYESDED